MDYKINPVTDFITNFLFVRKNDILLGVENKQNHTQESAKEQLQSLLDDAKEYVDSIESRPKHG